MILKDRQQQLGDLYHSLFPVKADAKAKPVHPVAGLPDDRNIVEKIIGLPKWKRLWEGDTTDYGSQSEADLALCGRIAFFTGRDAVAIDRIFRQSALHRDKWERRDYRERTIGLAIDGCENFYQWSEFAAMKTIQKEQRNTGGESIAIDRVTTRQGRTDIANAERFKRLYGDRVRYCHPWKKWLVWDGKRWKTDNDGSIIRLAMTVADDVWNEARKTNDHEALKHAVRVSSSMSIGAMLKLVRAMVPILPEDMDQNAFLLNCPNGTIDLRTGELREHRREDYITKLCPIEFDPDAPCPVWERFLDDVFEKNQDLIQYVQKLMGYCATGDVREQILSVPHGSGANGKSTLFDAVCGTLGPDYAGAAPRQLLMLGKADRHPTEIADLHGKRLVVAQETEQSHKLNEALVKQLTGGDPLKGRRMNEDFWEFNPTHKLVLCTNHKPRVSGSDHAIWRRIKLIPFTVRFDGDRRDKSMPDKLKAERQGILAWIVRGAVQWAAEGLHDPETVRIATAEYQSSEDVIGRFAAERCITGDGEVRAKDLRDKLEEWCALEGFDTPSSRAVGEWIEQHDDFGSRKSNGTIYTGLRLIDDS